MTEKRVQFNNIVENQLPSYVREEFPLVSEFLKQYYISQEFQGAPIDLIQSIDRYIKLNETTNLAESVFLESDISFIDETISVDLVKSPTGTGGFPDSYGLLKINDEIITYTGKTFSSFTGCIRGFSGIEQLESDNSQDKLKFSSTLSQDHSSGSEIQNLSILFLKEFLAKTKNQFLPGINKRNLNDRLNQNLFIKQSKDFYSTRGTDRSFEILFKALYDQEVKIVRPGEQLFTPSNADYRITNDLVVESISGDPSQLKNSTIFQEEYQGLYQKAYAPITDIETITSNSGQTFYKISYDSGYNRDIISNGSLYGGFKTHPKTKTIGQVSSGSTTIDVDSTVGFGATGELFVTYADSTTGVIQYGSKSLNQFYDCSGISNTISDNSTVGVNTYIRGSYFSFENVGSSSSVRTENIVLMRINSVISNFSYQSNTRYYNPNDSAIIKTLGSKSEDFASRNWFYNVSSSYGISSFTLLDASTRKYRIVLSTNHYLFIGDRISLIGNDNLEVDSSINEIESERTLVITTDRLLSSNFSYKVKRKILKVQSSQYPYLSNYVSNVQNVYVNDSQNKDVPSRLLVASLSLPSYDRTSLSTKDRIISFSGTFSGSEFEISNHGFYTGDAIYYEPEKIQSTTTDIDGNVSTTTVVNSSLFPEGSLGDYGEGIYFVTRIDSNKLKLSRSRGDSVFVSLDNLTTVTNNKLKPYNFRAKTLQPQKILREIKTPILDGRSYKTEPGYNGILINGVEILNYKSSEVINYGEISSIEVSSPGNNYDIINPPNLQISDNVGTGATGYVSILGSLKEIRLLDPGFDYQEIPNITITGGNGSGAEASVNMRLVDHSAAFFSDSSSNQVSIGSTTSTIGFSTYHKFRNSEKVIYDTSSQVAVGGITTNSTYFVSVIDPFTVRLHKTKDDSVVGINTVVLDSFGIGRHFLRSYDKKSVVDSINVVSGGNGYENKERTVNSSGINTALNQIQINNHDYNSGEIIKYSSGLVSIGGLVDEQEYIITKVDNNNFKLSIIGSGTTESDFYYKTKQYINLETKGSGTHSFNYPPIIVRVEGKIGISSVGTETFEARVQPIFRGNITSVHLQNGGVGYGSSEVINLNRQPEITLINGKNAQVIPIIIDGKISEVIVLNPGQNYTSPPDLVIDGDGNGAVITPVVSNGSLTSVVVIDSGVGYTQGSTSITVKDPSSGASFEAIIKRWRVNLFEKYFNTFTSDDGFISEGLNQNYGLQYSHIYAPRKLRESIFSVDQTGKVLYGQSDLPYTTSEQSPTNHSPIIGWAYDGHPIYGPYGYIRRTGGTVSQMKSSYVLNSSRPFGPPTAIYPLGFFVEDYTYQKVDDETVLDENNGRFCVTPEFPNGTYAYFATFNTSSVDTVLPFIGYKRPVFPYLIGDSFRGVPNEFNYKSSSNQEEYDLNDYNWFRNTTPYNIIDGVDDEIRYEYLNIPNNLNQTIDVVSTGTGGIESIGIETAGNNYQINDSIIFDETGTNGSGAIAIVSRVSGKFVDNISVATSSIENVSFVPADDKGNYVAICSNPHNFNNGDIVRISGLSTTLPNLEGSYTIGIGTTAFLSIAGVGTSTFGVGDVSQTGIVTYFRVVGQISNLRENDVLSIEQEKLKVLNVDEFSSRIRVLREFLGSTGSAHTARTVLYEDSRRFNINTGFKTSYNYTPNKEIYFNPLESVGLGTAAGVGIGTTIQVQSVGTGVTDLFIPTKAIFIKEHGLNTGDQINYFTNGGSPITTQDISGNISSLVDGQSLFVAKINDSLLGLSTVRVGLGTTGTFVGIASTERSSSTLFFTGIGTGAFHSFKSNYISLTGTVDRNLVTVSTAQTHGLEDGSNVFISVNPSVSVASTFAIKYNDYSRKLLVNPKDFISSGVSTTNGTIEINDHGFTTGQKVLYTAITPSGGLSDSESYFIVKVDNNRFKLSTSYYNSIKPDPDAVEITSASDGTISLINPPIESYRNSTIIFDLSDSSLSYTNQSTLYSAFELNFYVDENFENKYEKNSNSETFEVQRFGRVGITTNARVLLTINEETPNTLFYKLESINQRLSPQSKTEIIVDDEVISNNRIIPRLSFYNGKQTITAISTNTFTYTTAVKPERSSYISSTSSITYETDYDNAYGPISKIDVKSSGRNYTSLPGISSIRTSFGIGAILNTESSEIGRIGKTKIKDIGFDFSSDKTIRPSTVLPQIIKIDPLASFDFIGITSVGRGYSSAPKLIVLDGKTREVVDDVDLRYSLGDSNVSILRNTYGISNTRPEIIPTQNTNGVGISTIKYNSLTKDVTVILSVGFSTADTFPFEINDKVLVENVSIGVGSTGRGFNSKSYNYTLFTLTDVDKNVGGIGSITYNLDGLLNEGEFPGVFDAKNSSGIVVPEKYFPLFNPVLKTNDYVIGETVRSGNLVGSVQSWDDKNKILGVSSKDNFAVGQNIIGDLSNTQGISLSVDSFNSEVEIDSSSRVLKGWSSNSGFLNENLQRVQDSFYYQKFSYSLRSKVDYDTWEDVVGSLNHTLGFKKFSDYQLVTPASYFEIENNSLSVGLSTDTGYFESINDLTETVNLNCVYDFDLVRENSRIADSQFISDEIIFSSRVLSDYEESFGNRVLSIDDISDQFNSNPRSTNFSVVNRFNLSDVRAQKYITLVSDKRFTAQRQLLLVDLVHDDSFAYINQYGRVETQYDQGSFDFSIVGSEGLLLFYPTNSTVNDYNVTCLSYNIDDNLLGIGSTDIGGIGLINTDSVTLSSGITTSIVGVGSTYTSIKVLVQITPDINSREFEFEELNIVHDGTNIELLEYGQLTTVLSPYASSGLGTYYPYYSGSELKIDFVPNSGVGIGTTGVINTIQICLSDSSFSGIGTVDMKHAKIEVRSTDIPGSGSPTENVIGQYPEEYDAAYFVVQVCDTTNNNYQMSEVIVADDYVSTLGTGDVYDTEYGIIQTSSGIGTIGTRVSVAGTVELLFTPNPSIDTQVKVYMNALRHQDDSRDIIDFNNGTIETTFSEYTGTERDIRRSFNLEHKNFQIFERYFDGSSSSIVSISDDTITIPNHFFVSGENVVYHCAGAGSTQAIGIALTTLSGVGSTDKLPSGITTSLYVVKVDENKIKLASSAENALKSIPNTLDITSVGIGTSHRFVSTNQNPKVIITLDNVIQSPVVATSVTTTLSEQVFTTDNLIKVSGITSFFGSDLIRINDEIMKIEGIGIGSTNAIRVRRNWLGTTLVGHSTGDIVTKVVGNYNIVDNTLNFAEAPYGNFPIGTSTNPPDERDWEDISTTSTFSGRVFLRSGEVDSSDETYSKNYIFDDISSGFNGNDDTFTLKSNSLDVDGITTKSVILINDILQIPGSSFNYTLSENTGVTSITFNGSGVSIDSDVNTSGLPVGGSIVSVGSSEGFGYQPLVSAGGTAVVSLAGTIQSVSIGNSGSGYRASTSYEVITDTSSIVSSGTTEIYIENKNSVFDLINLLNTGSNCIIGVGTFIEPTTIVSVASTFVCIGIGSTSSYEIPTNSQVSVTIQNPQIGIVNIGVANSSTGISTVSHIGFATIISGNISTNATITNPGSGYTSTNPPFVVIDDPLSYSGIELIYSTSSTSSGLGTGAKVDIVVGQGSSVIDFEIINTGYGYGNGEILTIPIGGLTGIPTTTSFQEFQIEIQDIFSDEFSGWSVGEFELLDTFDDLFDSETVSFQLRKNGAVRSIVAGKGSNIEVQQLILVFINDILQVPDEGYSFPGGSIITFSEAPKAGDTCRILFYRGSGDIDVLQREVIETVKVGDELTIGYEPSLGQESYLQEESRTVSSINSIDVVNTIPYFGPGNTSDETLVRPVVWCRQTEDRIINGKEVGKDRELYEPIINPFAYVIKNVGIGSTTIYVDNLRPFFNPQNESQTTFTFQDKITLISQDDKVGASATAVVSVAGTISSIVINDGGSGYIAAPTITIGSTAQSIGLGTTATATASITSGIVTSISISNSGTGYTSSNPPVVLVSSPTSISETNDVLSYTGDSGIIVGFGTTTVSSVDKFVIDLHIPTDSYLRDSSLVGTALTISSLNVGDYFIVYSSNVGLASTTVYSRDIDNNIIGIGTEFIDNVYQVDSVSDVEYEVVGVGTTTLRRVFVRASELPPIYSGISTTYSSFGNFSWGKINLTSRSETNQYIFYGNNGITGITTSSIVKRFQPLRSINYVV